jgi:hypothetical protein
MFRIPSNKRSQNIPRSNRKRAASRKLSRSRRLGIEALEARQMLSHSPVEFSPPGLPFDDHNHGPHDLPHGLTMTEQTHWINGKPFKVITTFIAPELGSDSGTSVASTSSALYPLSSLPQLHSDSSATVKLYLDFDGDYEPNWGSGVTTPLFDFDGDPTTFSDAELESIHVAWAKVAEDFAPFNIDVTTVEPPQLADGVPETAANGIAQRIAIGGVGEGWGGGTGVAAIDSFTNAAANTAFVSLNAGPGWVGELASHEAGHAFGLLHQSTYDSNGVKIDEYHPGTATWAPIMGTSYRLVTTWYNGTSSSSSTSFQDDMAVLARSANGFGFRADDHGNSFATAAPFQFDGVFYGGTGLVGTNTDSDMWSFSVSTSDTYRLAVDPAEIGPNLDAVLKLWDATGSLIAMASPALSQAAELVLPLLPGNYFAEVSKVAAYGWLGAYSARLDAPPAGVTASPTETLLVPERGAASFTIALDTQPSADVTVSLSLSDAAQATLSAASLTFTAANWNLPQTVTVTGFDDGAIDGDVPFNVVLGPVASDDTEYNGLDPNDVAAVSTDHGYGGFLYWTDRDSDLIQRSPLTGGPIETLVDIKALSGATTAQTQLRGLSVDLAGGKMYWVDQSAGRIQRANLDGSNVETLLSGFAVGALHGIEVDSANGKIYWTDSATLKIQRANLDGTGIQDVVTQQTGLRDVTLDTAGGKMYWSDLDQNIIRRANLDGTGVEVLWTGPTGANPREIALDLINSKMYWYDSSQQQILRANFNGTGVEIAADLTGLTQSTLVWLNVDSRSGKLYWADYGIGTYYRCNLDGSGLTKIVGGLSSPQDTEIAVPGVSVSPHTGLLTNESGLAASFNVTLTTPPIGNVTIPISSTNSSEGTVSATNLAFTPANWNVPRTVTVTGVDDAVSDGNVAYSVLLGAVTSADSDYTAVNPRDVALTNVDNETKFYVVNDASTNVSYRYAGDGTPRGNSTLNTGNAAPRGVASTIAGDKIWVIDANRKVFVYSASGALLGSWTASSLANNANPEGIATNGTDVWIVDSKSDRVLRYAGAASRLSGTQTAVSSFNLNNGNSNAKDIVTDGSSLWVVNDASTDRVYKYSISGSLQGSWTIDSANRAPTGITIDPANVSHIWIVDSGTDRVYQYNGAATRTSGSQSAAASFALAAGNTNPQGIADPPAPAEASVAELDNAPTVAIATTARTWNPKPRPKFAAGTPAHRSIDPHRLYGANVAAEPAAIHSKDARIQFESEATTSVDAAMAEFGQAGWLDRVADKAYCTPVHFLL